MAKVSRLPDLSAAVRVQKLYLALDAIDRMLANSSRFDGVLFAQLMAVEAELLHEEEKLRISTQHEAAALRTEPAAAPAPVTRSLQTGLAEVDVYPQTSNVPTAISDILTMSDAPILACLVQVRAPMAEIRLSAQIDGFSSAASMTFSLRRGQIKTVAEVPFPPLHHAAMGLLDRVTNVMLKVVVEDIRSHEEYAHVTLPLWLLPRRMFPLRMYNPYKGEWRDTSLYLGAHVTPTEPDLVDLAFACTARDAGAKPGNGSQDPKSQVAALYAGLQKECRLTHEYSSALFDPTVGILSRRVRSPKETLAEERASALDGALLFASMLEYSGLDACLAITPATVLVGWRPGSGASDWQFLDMSKIDKGGIDVALEWGAAVADAHRLQGERTGDPMWWRLLPISTLRAEFGVWPAP